MGRKRWFIKRPTRCGWNKCPTRSFSAPVDAGVRLTLSALCGSDLHIMMAGRLSRPGWFWAMGA